MKPLPTSGGAKGDGVKNINVNRIIPLIQYAIEEALKITVKDIIIDSTNSEVVKSVIENFGIDVTSLCPKDLASNAESPYGVLKFQTEKLEKVGRYFRLLYYI